MFFSLDQWSLSKTSLEYNILVYRLIGCFNLFSNVPKVENFLYFPLILWFGSQGFQNYQKIENQSIFRIPSKNVSKFGWKFYLAKICT